MSSCLTHNFCFLWLWHIILGTWVYQNETMCHDIHDPDMTLTFYLKVKFIVFFKKASRSGHSFFVLWHSCTIFGTWESHHGTMCHIHSWALYDPDLLPQYQNYIFTMNLCLGKIIFALWHRHTKVSPWDKMLLYIHNTPHNELWRV